MQMNNDQTVVKEPAADVNPVSATIIKVVEGILELIAISQFPLETEITIEKHLNQVCAELDKFTGKQTP